MTHAGQCVCWGWGSTPLSKREDTTKIVEGYMGPPSYKSIKYVTYGWWAFVRVAKVRESGRVKQLGTLCIGVKEERLPMPNSNSSQASYIINFSYFCYSTYELYLFITRKINNVGCLCNS